MFGRNRWLQAGRRDVYGPLLGNILFPAFEAARGRPSLAMLRYLEQTQWWSTDQLYDLQTGLLRRLLRHAYAHTTHYRQVFDELGATPLDIAGPADLQRLPLLTRDVLRASQQRRVATVPPFITVRKFSSGTTGEPTEVGYNASSQHWRDAMRRRGYGWAGYYMGHRALHFWGSAPVKPPLLKRWKVELDHQLRRDLYIDANVRTPAALQRAVAHIVSFRPQVIVAYAQGAATLAKYINDQGLRSWDMIPMLVGAERLWPHDRATIEQAFGPALFETYGCREFMLIGSECEKHDGMHTSMETLIVEIVVRNPDGSTRAAVPGEAGDVVVTDLQNLACPLIRFVSGDRAIARAATPCSCGRGLQRIGPIDGRVAETLFDGAGNPTSGLIFSIVFVWLGKVTKQFQVIQRMDRSVVLRVVPTSTTLPEADRTIIRDYFAKYLPGAPLQIEVVAEIPLTKAGKTRIVINEGLTPPSDATMP